MSTDLTNKTSKKRILEEEETTRVVDNEDIEHEIQNLNTFSKKSKKNENLQEKEEEEEIENVEENQDENSDDDNDNEEEEKEKSENGEDDAAADGEENVNDKKDDTNLNNIVTFKNTNGFEEVNLKIKPEVRISSIISTLEKILKEKNKLNLIYDGKKLEK